ncbi:hypothetical protein ACFFV7_39720 [Nonomuraea spiralis]|uniref:Transposase n=1 Tax=Nonomuraea spiralis TaxID=46182 RepID=A0ABV5IS78_9ACTN
MLGVAISRQTVVRSLLRLPLPVRPTPEVIGVDDFALHKRYRYATVIIDAVTRERIDVLADHQADTLEAWLRAHPGVRVVCRDSIRYLVLSSEPAGQLVARLSGALGK